MSEGLTLADTARRERWCMESVEAGKEDWPKGASWHPYPGRCKTRGRVKVGDEWRCAKHLPKEAGPVTVVSGTAGLAIHAPQMQMLLVPPPRVVDEDGTSPSPPSMPSAGPVGPTEG